MCTIFCYDVDFRPRHRTLALVEFCIIELQRLELYNNTYTIIILTHEDLHVEHCL